MKQLFKKVLLSLVVLPVGAISAMAQANDWILPPSTHISFGGGSASVSSLSGSSAIAGCGASGSLPSQYAQVLSNNAGSGIAYINACGIYDVAGNAIGSGTGNAYQNVFTMPDGCPAHYAIQWENVGGLPPYNKLTVRTLDISTPTAITEVSSTDLVNDGFLHPNNAIAVAPLTAYGQRKVYTADGTSLSYYDVYGGTFYGPASIATLPGVIETRAGMEVSPDGTKLVFVSGAQVYMYDIPGNSFTAIGTFSSGTFISGIEYVPHSGSDRIYVSYHYYNGTTTVGHLDYISLSATSTNVDLISGLSAPGRYGYGYSEIERGKDGYLYLAYHNNWYNYAITLGDVGTLTRLDPSSGALSTVYNGATPVPVNSVENNWGYIIQKQIDGEDYDFLNTPISTPTFQFDNSTASTHSSVRNVYFCGGALTLSGTLPGVHSAYTVEVEIGTIAIVGGSPVFTPSASQPPINSAYIGSVSNTFSINLTSWIYTLGCRFNWLDNYRGPIRVTVTNEDPCATHFFSPYSTDIFNLVDPIDFLLTSIKDASHAHTGYSGNEICSSSALTDPISSYTLRAAGDFAQDRNLKIDNAGGDCGPRFDVFSWMTPNDDLMDPAAAPSCHWGWLGASSAGIYQPASALQLNPYAVNTGTAYNSFDIVVEEFTQPSFGDDLVPTNVNGTGNNLVVNDLGITTNLSTGGIPPSPAYYTFNAHPASGVPSNYFVGNYPTIAGGAGSQYVYKVTYRAHTNHTPCGDYSAVSYFRILDDGSHTPFNGDQWRQAPSGIQPFSMYPNPASEQLHFSWSNTGKAATAQAVITDVLGHAVQSQQYDDIQGSNSHSLDISALAPGVYHYSVNAGGGQHDGNFVKK